MIWHRLGPELWKRTSSRGISRTSVAENIEIARSLGQVEPEPTLKKDWRTSTTIAITALGFTALAFVVMPDASAKYWSQTLPDTGRIGPAYFANNESLKAVIARFAPAEQVGSLLWLVAAAAMLALAALAIRRALERGDLVSALLANAAAILLASPVSWSHHWVWAAPSLLTLTIATVRALTARNVLATIGIGALFLIGPQHLLPTASDRELDWALWQHLLGTLYVTVGLGFLLWLAYARDRQDSQHTAPAPAIP